MDNEAPRIQYCQVPQCKVCRNKQLDTCIEFHSNLNKKLFTIGFSQNCKTNLVIYLISCKHPQCSLKYTGRTHHAINRRFSLHRANIIAGTEGPAMMHHFTKVHQPSDMVIKAIEVCSKQNIKEREKFWIAELNTAFPYGLNDRIDAPSIQDAYKYTLENTSTNKAIYETFNKVPSQRTKRGGSKRNRQEQQQQLPFTSSFNPATFMDNITTTNLNHKEHFTNYVRTQIMRLDKNKTKLLFLHLCTCINDHNHFFHKYNSNHYTSYLAYLSKDITFAKLKAMYTRSKQQSNRHFMVIEFSNKHMDSINFNRIFKNQHLANLFPAVEDTSMNSPIISFKYTQPIKSKITNYRQVIQEGTNPTECDCHLHDEQYKVNGHIFTGNLGVIRNQELRTLLGKGLNYRETPSSNKDSVIKSIREGIESYIQQISTATRQHTNAFIPWKTELLHRIKLQLHKLNEFKYNNVLAKSRNRNDLKSLQQKWVFTPTDKAANNITVVCKKYYMDILDDEIYSSGNFERFEQPIDNILDQQANFLSKYKLNTEKKLPFLYWTAKLHKDPFSQRFITSGRGCVTQPLSIQVGYCLKTVLNIVRSNARYHRKRFNINKCFVIDNRDPVISFIQQCNRTNNVRSVSTFDFKTLYTSIPHDKLNESLSQTIRSAFTSRKKKFISVTGKRAILSDVRKASLSFSVQQLINSVNFLIDNSYILYKGEVFRQCIGIPMGTNCAPYLANLFLHRYECKYIEELVESNQPNLALAIANMFRYQDDCIIINDQGMFAQLWKDIYPEEMQLEQTNAGNICTFLDLVISIVNGRFVYRSYDKRKDYNFEVINYPDLRSNVPRGPSYGVFHSQLVRFCDINCDATNFKTDVNCLVRKLVDQQFQSPILKTKFKQFYGNNLRWSKFGTDIEDIADLFL